MNHAVTDAKQRPGFQSRKAGNLEAGGKMSDAVKIEHLEKTSQLYYELLFAVGQKWPNESRHETALRYIRERETHTEREAKHADTIS